MTAAVPDGAPDVTGCLDRLRAGALDWVSSHARFLDSPLARAELPPTPRAKAFIQLAQLCHCWIRLRPADPGLNPVLALVEQAWRGPELADTIAADPRWARQYGLMYSALAVPADAAGARAVLAWLTADGFLASPGRSPYLRLETRYYADLAAARHGIESYRELYESSLLARRATAPPAAEGETCEITNTVFYLSHFGFRDPCLRPPERAQALAVISDLTHYYVEREDWYPAAKCVLAQFLLGADPAGTQSGSAAIGLLRQAQEPSGAIPASSLRQKPAISATALERFRKAYQPTMMTALVALVISCGPYRPGRTAA